MRRGKSRVNGREGEDWKRKGKKEKEGQEHREEAGWG